MYPGYNAVLDVITVCRLPLNQSDQHFFPVLQGTAQFSQYKGVHAVAVKKVRDQLRKLDCTSLQNLLLRDDNASVAKLMFKLDVIVLTSSMVFIAGNVRIGYYDHWRQTRRSWSGNIRFGHSRRERCWTGKNHWLKNSNVDSWLRSHTFTTWIKSTWSFHICSVKAGLQVGDLILAVNFDCLLGSTYDEVRDKSVAITPESCLPSKLSELRNNFT